MGAFSSLIQELRGLVSTSKAPPPHYGISPSSWPPNQTTSTPAAVGSPNDGVSVANGVSEHVHGQTKARKRRRVDSCGNPNIELASQLVELATDSTKLPPPEPLEAIIDAYFGVIQPWIPIVHETYFRRRLDDDEQRPQLIVLLHAMVVAAARFSENTNQSITAREIEVWTSRSRRMVKLSAMEGLSVENLQALIIIVYHDVRSRSLIQGLELTSPRWAMAICRAPGP